MKLIAVETPKILLIRGSYPTMHLLHKYQERVTELLTYPH